jgi:hypothetical protein
VGYNEKWYDCPNQSSRGGSGIAQLTFHTTEGAETGESLANWICQEQAQASYHAAVDNTAPNEVHRFVDTDMKAWSQAAGNPFAVSVAFCTPSGAASNWSRDKWLSMGTMLDNAAAIGKKFCDMHGIPLTPLNASQAQSGARGISQHVDGGSSWSGHHDCGNGFPEDEVIRRMKGQAPSQPEAKPEEDEIMIGIPPGQDVGYSFPKFYKSMGAYADVGRLTQSGAVEMRCVFHYTDNTIHVVEFELTAKRPKYSFSFAKSGKDADGAAFYRSDSLDIIVVPNFA